MTKQIHGAEYTSFMVNEKGGINLLFIAQFYAYSIFVGNKE